MPGGQFSHFRDKMSLARDTGHHGSIPGRSRPFRDGWQPYAQCTQCNEIISDGWPSTNDVITLCASCGAVYCNRSCLCHTLWVCGSDVNKDLGPKAKAKAKDTGHKVKAKAKALGYQGPGQGQGLGSQGQGQGQGQGLGSQGQGQGLEMSKPITKTEGQS